MSSPESGAPPALPPNAFEDATGKVIGVATFCLVISTLMVGLRLWTRKIIINQLGWDDYTIILGLIATYGSAISIMDMTKYGLGKHIYVMELANIPKYFKDFYLSIVFYCAALFFIKLAFLFQYYRVLAIQHMRIVYIIAIIVVGGWALSQTFVGIFTCTPINGFWDKTIESKCIPNIPQWYINAAGNIITDVAVFCLPLPAIWKLQLPKQQKIILIGVFGLGFFTVIVSVIRIRYLKLFEDFPWENVTSSLWSVGELTSAITCCCLPTLRPLVGRYFPNFIGGTGAGSRPTAGGYGHSGYGKATGSKGTVPSRSEAEMGSKRGIPLSGNDSGSELASPRGKEADHDVELNDNLSPFRSGDDDARSLGSEASELALAPRRPGVGVRTEIIPVRPGKAASSRVRSFSGGGVQVQREVYQTTAMGLQRG
ncbi:hypothetical protein B0T14DRAFT_601099 [Immersiella caudata]|uniref:Rhodopsin domain-containing protein n=1 Tax=Immersiella caudata TaxID=314043 RepID=A0AA39WVG6_9PEZI|nr:hypothetical protein B0T14DRAFT_489801 [Immersiella caudata]KAK0622306.1 hypothetical protein B0T14DRAFT_601099 [Immersiella caudata]